MSMTDVHSAPRANHGADWDQIRRRAKSILVHGIVLALVGLMLLPLVYMVMMSFKTSTEIAPWTLVPGNDKRYARIEVMKTFCERLEAALG